MLIWGVALSWTPPRQVDSTVGIGPVHHLDSHDRTQEQEAIYALLVSLQAELLPRLKDGAVAKELYHHALSYVKEHKPELEAHFVKNLGHGVCLLALPRIPMH